MTLNSARFRHRQLQRACGALALILWTPLALAAPALESTLVTFLKAQNAHAPGAVHITVHRPRVHMSHCHSPQPFLPGTRTAGRITVGVRCPGDKPAIRYFQADVRIVGLYFVTAHTIKPGETITRTDIRPTQGDLTRLSGTVVTNPADVLGQVAVRRIGAAMPLRTNMVARPKAIKRGDSVRIVARGQGFSITTDGIALSGAALGDAIRVRTAGGQVLTGVTRPGHMVNVRP
jgi:flagella basal body P-ring formation protein FlgA